MYNLIIYIILILLLVSIFIIFISLLKIDVNQQVKLSGAVYDPCVGISCEKRLPYIQPIISNNQCLCSKGYGLYEYDNKKGKYCTLISDPNPLGPIVQPKPTLDNAIYDTIESCNKNAGCYPGYTGDNCENIVDVNSYSKEQVRNILNNLPFVKDLYNGNFSNLFNVFPRATYVLIHCINSNSPYYNFCSNGGMNYYSENTPVNLFHKSIFGENKGDLVYASQGESVGFWWNNTDCSPGKYGPYISVNPYGTLRPESSLGPNAKFFENIINYDEDTRIDTSSGPIFGKSYKNIGVLLIGPTT